MLACVALAGCQNGSYLRERLLDATDVVDLKSGSGGIGLGLKVEVSEYLGAGIGYWDGEARESFGRDLVEQDLFFAHAVVAGYDGDLFGPGELNVLLVGIPEHDRPQSQRFRVGAEVLLPWIQGGAYLNLVELGDFLAGWFGADFMDDDEGEESPELERPETPVPGPGD